MAMELCSPSAPSPSFFSAQASLHKEKAFSPLPAAKLPSTDGPARRALAASVLPSSVLGAWLAGAPASAISYDEITLSAPSAQAFPDDFDVGAIANSVSSFVAENPLAVAAGLAAVAFPLVVSGLFSQAKPWGSVSAREALKKLETEGAQLVDIRSSSIVKMEGAPDLQALKKRVYQIPYTAGEDDAFLKKLFTKFKEPSGTTLYILDQFDGNSLSVAKIISDAGFKSAYAIKGGAEGPNGWRSKELPWILPRKGFTLDVSGVKDAIDSTFTENPNLVPATLGIAAAAGVSLVVFSEAETALQLLGSAALLQLFVKKFLFAKDRKRTFQELQTFLDTRIAPKEMVDELKGIGEVLLPKYDEVAPARGTNGATSSTKTIEVSEVQPSVATIAEQQESKDVEAPKESLEVQTPVTTVAEQAESKAVEAPKETAPETPLAAAASTNIPPSATPLSPYSQFSELKPPSFPNPPRP